MTSGAFTEKDNLAVRSSFERLLTLARSRCRGEEQIALIKKAFELACEGHRGVRLHSGEPYILHPLAVAEIVVSKVGLGYHSICAALLHDVPGNTQYTVDNIRTLFDDKIARLVEGLVNLEKILRTSPAAASESEQAENFKRVLLTMGDDVRVVLIKLADQLQNCRNLDDKTESDRERLLGETMFIFIPLAHRLGLYSIKSELENIWLRYTHPSEYSDIESRIDKDVAQRTRDMDEFIAPISKALEDKGYTFSIKKRIKTPYSIWYKMRNKHVPFEQIYDLYAVRIIFDPLTDDPAAEREQAYIIYSIVGQLYRDKPSRMRDWIRQPKSNGYEALHCTLMSKAGIWVEVQIRSRRMDDIAEKGIAAHWTYKNDGYLSESDSQVDRWLAKVQDILSSNDIDSLELLDIIQDDIVTNEIVVFTPKGDQCSIPKGSTALDFAYQVHTNVGNRAIAAKVNMKLSPLSHQLKAGDQVEILTARNARPNPEWLRFLHTRNARRKLMDFIREYAPDQLAQAEEILREKSESGSREMEEIPVRIVLHGINRPGLTNEIENALKRIDGIQSVEISDL